MKLKILVIIFNMVNVIMIIIIGCGIKMNVIIKIIVNVIFIVNKVLGSICIYCL